MVLTVMRGRNNAIIFHGSHLSLPEAILQPLDVLGDERGRFVTILGTPGPERPYPNDTAEQAIARAVRALTQPGYPQDSSSPIACIHYV